MKKLILLYLLVIISPKIGKAQYFDSRLSAIANSFVSEIFDEDRCDANKNSVYYLITDIEDYIDDEDLSTSELNRAKASLEMAKALSEFISCVGGCGNGTPCITQFIKANSLINASLTYISKGKYCVDVIEVRIGDFICYVVENNSSNNYTVTYSWVFKNSRGTRTVGNRSKSIRHIMNNREHSYLESITNWNINCKTYGKSFIDDCE